MIIKARKALTLVEGQESALHHFEQIAKVFMETHKNPSDQAEYHFSIRESDGGRWSNQKLDDYRLTRHAAYLVAMAGDDTKEALTRSPA